MGHYQGRVTEIRFDARWHMEAFISAPAITTPQAGQYLLACDPDDPSAVLGAPVFAIEQVKQGFWVAPPIPSAWKPGTNLDLVGPLGHGFDLRRSAPGVGGTGETAGRLRPD
jgi:NAD(P)H-flavin reductase